MEQFVDCENSKMMDGLENDFLNSFLTCSMKCAKCVMLSTVTEFVRFFIWGFWKIFRVINT